MWARSRQGHQLDTSATVTNGALREGKIDAFSLSAGAAGTAGPQDRHVIVNSTLDRPCRSYFCCMLAGNADFVRNNPARDQACPARDPESG